MPRIARVLLGYTLLALLLTWPLAATFATHVPGDGIDDPSLAWNLWWVKHALVDQPQNPFACNWQFWPIGINLAFYTLTVLNGMLSAPLQGVFGLIPSYNVLLLSSFVLSGLGGYLLSLEFLRKAGDRRLAHTVAFVGGALYAFASAKLFYAALGQGNIASSQWAPFAALYIWRAARRGGRIRDAAMAALFLALQAYAELTYASFLLVFGALAVVWGLLSSPPQPPSPSPKLRRSSPPRPPSPKPQLRRGGRKGGEVVIGRFAVMGLLFVLAIAPVLANMIPDLAAEGDFFTSGGGFADVFSADLAGYLAPTQLHPLLGGIVRGWSDAAGGAGATFAVDKGQHIYVGYVALGLAVIGLLRRPKGRETWLWAAAAVLFFLLTLGPSLRIAGRDTGIPLPFRIMEQLPFFKGNRYPSRYSVMLLLSLAPLVSAGAYRLLSGRTRATEGSERNQVSSRRAKLARNLVSLAGVLLLSLMLFEHLSAPLPVFDLRVPVLYQRVAQEPGDFALLELPLGWRNGARVAGKQDVLIMQQLWYQTAHGKRVLGGNTSRNPEYKFQYFSEQPTLARLIAAVNAADIPQHDALRETLAAMPVTEADRQAAREWAAFTNIRMVMVHRDKLPAEVEALARDLLPLSLVAEDGPLALYAVEPDDAPATYRLAADDGRMVLGEGWSPVAPGSDGLDDHGNVLGLFAQRQEVRLLLPLGTQAATLRLRAGGLLPPQQLAITIDGRPAGTQGLPMQRGWIAFDVPPDATRPPVSDVRLHFNQITSVRDVAALLSRSGPAGLLVRSAGQEAGDFAHIYLDGREASPNRRGYNLVAVDQAGALLDAASFDTHGDPGASAAMANWLARWPEGTVIAGAVRDEASMNLGQEAVDALARLGLSGDLRGHFRWGHAFIAAKGEAGFWAQRQEGMDAIRPVQLSVGFALSEPQVAAQVFEMEIVK